jgi:putative membrane protein (TIGR04086 family)
MKIFLKALLYMAIGFLGFTLILTLLHYFDLIGENVLNISRIVLTIIVIGIGGYIVGSNTKMKGWFEGLKLSLMLIAIFFVLTLIFRLGLSYKTLIYYAIIIITSIFGSMIGISMNEKTPKKKRQ